MRVLFRIYYKKQNKQEDMNKNFLFTALFCTALTFPAGAFAQKVIEATPGSLETVLSTVRKSVKKQKEDVIVRLHGGTYTLKKPLVLDEAYSGQNGHRVIFRAAEGETPVLSGGVKVTGWEKVSGNLYKAPFNSDKKLRTLLVNGVRARMAGAKRRVMGQGSEGTVEVKGTESWAFGTGKSVDGVKFLANEELTMFHNPEDVEVVQNKVWTEKIFCLRDIEKWGDTIVARFQQPYGAILNSLAWAGKVNYHGEFYFRNAYELLDEPGEFYYDRKAKTLYYYSQGEDMDKAEVIAPVSEGLIRIQGSSLNSRVANISFEGITFSHDSWSLMDIEGSHGFGGIQSLGLAVKYIPDGNWHPTHYNSCDVPTGSIDIQNATGIRLIRNKFVHLGSAIAVNLVNDVTASEVTGNFFNDLLGNAVSVGHPQHYEIGDGTGKYPATVEGVCRNIHITNNYVRNVSLDFRQVEAMLGFFVEDVHYEHNDIERTPYGAIALGWWWGNAKTPESKVAKNNSISYNRIGKTHLVLNDGGVIYLLGKQPGSVIRRNYLFDGPRCIYPDDGSSGWYIEENVINSLFQLWYHLASDRNYDITARRNFVKDNYLVNNGRGTKIEDTQVFRNYDFNDEAKSIMSEAGIEKEYKDIIPAEEPKAIHIYPKFPKEKWIL